MATLAMGIANALAMQRRHINLGGEDVSLAYNREWSSENRRGTLIGMENLSPRKRRLTHVSLFLIEGLTCQRCR
jgi:hypothetical protein